MKAFVKADYRDRRIHASGKRLGSTKVRPQSRWPPTKGPQRTYELRS